MALGTSFVAPLRKRIAAEAIDTGMLLFVTALILNWFVDVKSGMPLIYSLFALSYLAYNTLFLSGWEGETPGRRIMNIRVVSTNSNTDGQLSSLQQFGRPAVRLGMFSLAVAADEYIDIPAALLLPFALDIVLIQMGFARQSLPDIICRTLVINLPPVQPHRAPAGPMFSATDAEFGVRPQKLK